MRAEFQCNLRRGVTVPSGMLERGGRPVTIEGGMLSGEQIAATSTARLVCCYTVLVVVPSALLK